MIVRYDQWLVDRFEQFAHWWQRTFGQDCFWWARVCATLVIVTIIGIPTGCLFLLVIPEEKKGAYHRLESGCANPRRIEDSGIRVVLIGFAGVVFAFILFVFNAPAPARLFVGAACILYSVLCLVTLYFLSCTPLPPAKSKVRKKLEAFAAEIKRTFAPLPQPVPVPVPSR